MRGEENTVNYVKTALFVVALLAVATAPILAETPDQRMRVGSGAVERDSWTGSTGGLPVRVVNHHGDVRLRHGGTEGNLEAAAVLQQLDVDGSKLALDVTVTDDALVVSILRYDLEGALITQPSRTQLARADLAVLVPTGAPVRAETTFGLIEARGVETDVDLETLNGTIRVAKTKGAVTASSRLGAVEVTLEADATKKPQRLTTETGPVTVFTPPDNDLDVTMKTSGAFITDFSLHVEHNEHEEPDKTATATVGEGGAPLVLASKQGDLGLRRVVPRR